MLQFTKVHTKYGMQYLSTFPIKFLENKNNNFLFSVKILLIKRTFAYVDFGKTILNCRFLIFYIVINCTISDFVLTAAENVLHAWQGRCGK